MTNKRKTQAVTKLRWLRLWIRLPIRVARDSIGVFRTANFDDILHSICDLSLLIDLSGNFSPSYDPRQPSTTLNQLSQGFRRRAPGAKTLSPLFYLALKFDSTISSQGSRPIDSNLRPSPLMPWVIIKTIILFSPPLKLPSGWHMRVGRRGSELRVSKKLVEAIRALS